MTATAEEYRSELFRELAARNQQIGEARGEARGEGRAVLTVLAARGVPVPDAARERILACTDLAQLDAWLHRAGTATSIEQVLD